MKREEKLLTPLDIEKAKNRKYAGLPSAPEASKLPEPNF